MKISNVLANTQYSQKLTIIYKLANINKYFPHLVLDFH